MADNPITWCETLQIEPAPGDDVALPWYLFGAMGDGAPSAGGVLRMVATLGTGRVHVIVPCSAWTMPRLPAVVERVERDLRAREASRGR